ncbi:MAG: UDP-3-O-(3-hydroxymyristoyl)glucosamine N-acyltransferase [Acidobacteriota bacterium]
MQLAEIAKTLGAELRGDTATEIHGVGPLDRAQAGELTFVRDTTPLAHAINTPASALIVSPALALRDELAKRVLLIVANPKLAFAKAIRLFWDVRYEPAGVSPDLVLGPESQIGTECSIHSRVTIGRSTVIGSRVTLHPGVVIGDGVNIGDETVIFANVSIYSHTQIGRRCRIHSGTVIGSEGFSFVPDENGHQYKLLHIGRVVIEDDVEIGANCCIDRAGFGETRIRRGAKFDNLIQIGHNCDIGEDTVVASLAGFSGGTIVGRNCIIAGQIGTNQHITIGDGAIVTARSGVTKNVKPGALVGGVIPAMDYQKWRRAQALYSRLPELFERLKKLEAGGPDPTENAN